MIRIFKKTNESTERLISKFNKIFQKSRKALKVQETRYNRKKVTKNKQKVKAQKREFYRAVREKAQFR